MILRLGGLEGVDSNGQKRSFHLSDYRYFGGISLKISKFMYFFGYFDVLNVYPSLSTGAVTWCLCSTLATGRARTC